METLFELKIDIPNRLVIMENGDNQYPIFIPQDGDIIYGKSKNGDSDRIDIIEWYGKETHSSYIIFDISEDRIFPGDLETPHDDYDYAMATEEQKQMLFDRLKRDGKQWCPEKGIVANIHEQLKETIRNILHEVFKDFLNYVKENKVS